MVLDRPGNRYRYWDWLIGVYELDGRVSGLKMMGKLIENGVTNKQQKFSTTLLKPLRAFYARRNIRIPRNIPLRILSHGRRIILGLEKGKAFSDYRGKRLAPDRDVISIPVGRRWRLLMEWREDRIVPVRLLSHEAYNHKSNWEKRWHS